MTNAGEVVDRPEVPEHVVGGHGTPLLRDDAVARQHHGARNGRELARLPVPQVEVDGAPVEVDRGGREGRLGFEESIKRGLNR